MSERMTSGSFEFDQEQVVSVRELGQRALAISEERYCSGFPEYEGGAQMKLGFNNALHNSNVGEGAMLVGERLGLTPSEQELARLAGRSHDIVQLTGRGNDERSSAEWIEAQLRKRDFPIAAAKLAGLAILGTLPVFENGDPHGKVIGQMGNHMTFDSKRDERFVKSVISADLGDVYKPIGPHMSHMLYLQYQGLNADEIPNMDGILEFQKKQTSFLEDYSYPVAEAEDVLATHRSQVMAYTYYLYEQLEAGKIETWDEIKALDTAFLRNPNMQLV